MLHVLVSDYIGHLKVKKREIRIAANFSPRKTINKRYQPTTTSISPTKLVRPRRMAFLGGFSKEPSQVFKNSSSAMSRQPGPECQCCCWPDCCAPRQRQRPGAVPTAEASPPPAQLRSPPAVLCAAPLTLTKRVAQCAREEIRLLPLYVSRNKQLLAMNCDLTSCAPLLPRTFAPAAALLS